MEIIHNAAYSNVTLPDGETSRKFYKFTVVFCGAINPFPLFGV